ncbi:Ubc-19p [Parelaphostrongylus tenuis]|uniref:Ubc-19p n=1 Tax=Parelaphostrongylus tenuis TaxID=148309 RepID=A0AAD5NAM1_PARTN|nr:Ubc-19p [Parelaphostrongylus tenuis]
MVLGWTMSFGNEDNGCEFAVEAKVIEPLKVAPSRLARHALSSEFARVCRQPIDGMYIVPSANDQFTWFGLLFIRRGVFGGGIFRFSIRMPNGFPNTVSLPVVKFDLHIFHPDICPETRILDLRRYFPEGWKKDKHHVHNVLMVVQRLFFSSFEFDPDSCANRNAALTWRDDKAKFRSIAKTCVNQSRMEVYGQPENADDPNVLRLTPWDPSLHEQVRNRMMSYGDAIKDKFWWERDDKPRSNHGVGLSWVDPDAMTYMTEPVKNFDFPDVKNNCVRGDNDRLIYGIERLDLSGIQQEHTVESDRTDASLEPISLPSTTSFSSPEHKKLESENDQHPVFANVFSSQTSHETEVEITDV